jgi:hypothetical protein
LQELEHFQEAAQAYQAAIKSLEPVLMKAPNDNHTLELLASLSLDNALMQLKLGNSAEPALKSSLGYYDQLRQTDSAFIDNVIRVTGHLAENGYQPKHNYQKIIQLLDSIAQNNTTDWHLDIRKTANDKLAEL